MMELLPETIQIASTGFAVCMTPIAVALLLVIITRVFLRMTTFDND
jgi:hypothetical protein